MKAILMAALLVAIGGSCAAADCSYLIPVLPGPAFTVQLDNLGAAPVLLADAVIVQVDGAVLPMPINSHVLGLSVGNWTLFAGRNGNAGFAVIRTKTGKEDAQYQFVFYSAPGVAPAEAKFLGCK